MDQERFSLQYIKDNYPRKVPKYYKLKHHVKYSLSYLGICKRSYYPGRCYFSCDQNGKIRNHFNTKKIKYICYFNTSIEFLSNHIYFTNHYYSLGSMRLGSCNIIDPKYIDDIVEVEVCYSGCDLSILPSNIKIFINDWIDLGEVVLPKQIKCLQIGHETEPLDLVGIDIEELIIESPRNLPEIRYTNIGTITLWQDGYDPLPRLIGPPTIISDGESCIPWDEYPNKTEVVPVLTKSATKM